MTKIGKSLALCLSLLFFVISPMPAKAQDAQALVGAAVDYYRGKASISLMDITIHRPNWERILTIKAWTKGQKESLITIIAPLKDKGNGTLKKGREILMGLVGKELLWVYRVFL